MTEITLDRHDNEFTVECEGHATGSAVVCSAISAIMITIANMVLSTDSVVSKQITVEDGYLLCKFSGQSEAELLYRFAQVGLMGIAESYSEYAKIKKISVYGGEN